jgi:hypothetical protein
MAWMTVGEKIVVNLDEVVLVTQWLGSPETSANPVKPLITTVHLRGGSTFTLKDEPGIAFRKYFLLDSGE